MSNLSGHLHLCLRLHLHLGNFEDHGGHQPFTLSIFLPYRSQELGQLSCEIV